MYPIFLVHGSAGSGHRSVAQAVNAALVEAVGDQNGLKPAVVADSLSFGSSLFRTMYGKGYEWTAKYARTFCEGIYKLTDKPFTRSRLVHLVEFSSMQNIRGMRDFILTNRIDTVCCTHFLPMTLLANMKRKGIYQGEIHVCVTDYETHGFWADPDVDRYYTASPEAAATLEKWDIPAGRITVTGIPVRREFVALREKAATKKRKRGEGLRLLFVPSAMRTKEALAILEEINSLPGPFSLTVVTGRNERLFRNLADYRASSCPDMDLRGFEPDMDKVMEAADLLITKPGGITTSEALCAGLPMLFVAPIPMQEVHNARILSGSGAGISCFEPGSVARALTVLTSDSKRLTAMRKACRDTAKPAAAASIAENLLGSAVRHSE